MSGWKVRPMRSRSKRQSDAPTRDASPKSEARGEGFLELCTVPFPVTVLAWSDLPRPADIARRAAQVLVGAVDGSRVPRVAEQLEKLMQLDGATARKK